MELMATAAQLTPEQRRAYARALRQAKSLDPRAAKELEGRRAAAWQAAQEAAAALRDRFGASRVVVFGSLARGDFTLGSDIDMAAWGVSPRKYFGAVSFLLDLGADFGRDGRGFRIDVVAGEAAPERLRSQIEREGVAI